MVQDQLTDYISSQIKLGVSRDAIKSALVSAGWVSVDVEDTLKKVEGGASAGAVGQPAVSAKPAAASISMSSMTSAKPADTGVSSMGAKMSGPQMIRVSDLVSGSSSSSTGGASSAHAAMSSPLSSPAAASSAAKSNLPFSGKISGNSFQAAPSGGVMHASGGSKSMLTWVIAGVLVLIFAGLAWYFYSANAGLASQVTSLTSESTSVTTQLSSLKSQLDASSSDYANQIATLNAANADLALDLSFYAVPLNTSSTATPVTVNGSLSGGVGKSPYLLTTSNGAKIFVANSTDVTIAAELKPLMGDTVQVAGTYVPGSDEITVSSVSTSTQP